MSVLHALFNSYNYALNNNMVDRTDLINQETIILPVYHNSKKANNYDIVEITLSEKGQFIKAEWLPKDSIIIFPISEISNNRTSGHAPHPLCDELSYLSKEINAEKHEKYIKELNDWVNYMIEHNYNFLLDIVSKYINQGTILEDCVSSIFISNYSISKDYKSVIHYENNQSREMKLDKIFVTFKIELKSSVERDLSVTLNTDLHMNYINYVRYTNSFKDKKICDISGEEAYCVSKHQGLGSLMGRAKIISSNRKEVFWGRFTDEDEIISISYEVSQKIHLMLKYLLENKHNRRSLGDGCYLLNWFSDDIKNENSIDIVSTLCLYEDDDEIFDDKDSKSFGGGLSLFLNEYITGIHRDINKDSKFYIMILDKITDGRVSIKYFRELPKSDLIQRIGDWYTTTSWSYYDRKFKRWINKSPSIQHFVDALFGLEGDKGYLELRNTNLKTKTIERLIPCVLEKKRFPLDLKNKILENLRNRRSYDKTWDFVLSIGCSIFKKCKFDYLNRMVSDSMLDLNKQSRSYLFGRLLAVYEKLELDTYRNYMIDNANKRTTNAERLWTAYAKMPTRTLLILEEKIKPYKERLKKSNFSAVVYYDNLITEIVNTIETSDKFEQVKNRPLNEDFVLGYYAQKKEFYKKRESSIDD